MMTKIRKHLFNAKRLKRQLKRVDKLTKLAERLKFNNAAEMLELLHKDEAEFTKRTNSRLLKSINGVPIYIVINDTRYKLA